MKLKMNEFQILLVDDDEDDYVNIRDLLEEVQRAKYKVVWKASYNEGLEALSKNQFDICLLDYRLGEHTGLELLKEAHKIGFTGPIIFLTGQGDFDLDLQAMQIGAADYLVKDKLTAPLLERAIRYSIKHSMDMQELKESKAQILQQDRLASLGLLASSLAHEIGTPLGVIRGRAELAQKKAADSEAVKQNMQVIVSQIDKITGLVQSLLNLAREKKTDLISMIDIKQTISDVLNLVEHELRRKNIALTVKMPDAPVQAMAESGPLGQVLLNLLVNSVHAIQEILKKNPKHPSEITLSVENSVGFVDILVEDTGSGIDEKNISQIFKPFFTTKDIGTGTGLGLATSYKIIQSWSGSISVQSKMNQGTKFIIRLIKK